MIRPINVYLTLIQKHTQANDADVSAAGKLPPRPIKYLRWGRDLRLRRSYDVSVNSRSLFERKRLSGRAHLRDHKFYGKSESSQQPLTWCSRPGSYCTGRTNKSPVTKMSFTVGHRGRAPVTAGCLSRSGTGPDTQLSPVQPSIPTHLRRPRDCGTNGFCLQCHRPVYTTREHNPII